MNNQERNLGDGFFASAISYGAMGLSEFYGPPLGETEAQGVLDKALELGVTMIDTADMYGRGRNEELIGRFLARHRTDKLAGRIKIATKFGLERDEKHEYNRRINNSPAYIRLACEKSLKRLGLERIDLYYAHRLDPTADLAATMSTLADLVKEGKVAHIGLCEVSAATLTKAHSLTPVAVVQSEYSLWTREAEDSVLPACRESGIGFVAYSPLGRGFLSGAYKSADAFAADDFRRSNPRFQVDNMNANRKLLGVLQEVAAAHGATPAQTALAWLLTREAHLAVIPGTRNRDRLSENMAAGRLRLPPADMARLEETFRPEAVHGERYTPEGLKGLNA